MYDHFIEKHFEKKVCFGKHEHAVCSEIKIMMKGLSAHKNE